MFGEFAYHFAGLATAALVVGFLVGRAWNERALKLALRANHELSVENEALVEHLARRIVEDEFETPGSCRRLAS
jgi:hypothetical protein